MINDSHSSRPKLVVTLTFLLVFNGCSSISDLFSPRTVVNSEKDQSSVSESSEQAAEPPVPENLDKGTTAVEIKELPTAPTQKEVKSLGVEITWKVPPQPTEGFVIHYGYSRENLDHETQVTTDQLIATDDSKYGAVYSYILKDVSPDQTLFVAISAFNDIGVSDMSEIFEVK